MNTLGINHILFDEFETKSIRYCHWKSNEHLLAGLLGDTDLDILVHPEDRATVEQVFDHLYLKRFVAVKMSYYPGLQDYLGLDWITGKLIHVHLHYKLSIGEKFLKNYDLPWADKVLTSSKLSSGYKVKISDPYFELFHLFLRESLKIRSRDYIMQILGKSYLSENFYREYRWLVKQTKEEKICKIAQQCLSIGSDNILESLMCLPSFWSLARLRCKTRKALREYRRLSTTEGWIERHLRELNWLIGAISKRLVQPPHPFRRTMVGSAGLIIAIVGIDGAGKSTIIKIIKKWLSWKMDVYLVYFGSGDGSSSFLRLPMLLALRVFKRYKRGSNTNRHKTHKKRKLTFARFLWAIALAFEKRNKMKKLLKAKNKRMVVLTDRYPQTCQPGFNDGPLLTDLLDNKFGVLKKIAKWEYSIYFNCERLGPDLLIKLMVSPDTAAHRKSGMNKELLKERRDVIEMMQKTYPDRVCVVNAEKTLESVLIEIKRAIWSRI